MFSHEAFAKELGGIPFELIADFERTMVTDYDVRRDDVAGYKGMAKRTVYVIDHAGRHSLGMGALEGRAAARLRPRARRGQESRRNGPGFLAAVSAQRLEGGGERLAHGLGARHRDPGQLQLVPWQQLSGDRKRRADDGGHHRVAAGRLMVGHQQDRQPAARHLHRACHQPE